MDLRAAGAGVTALVLSFGLGVVVVRSVGPGPVRDLCGLRAARGPNPDEQYPTDELVHWVSYGDAVVVAEVISEEELLPTSGESFERGEGYIPRRVTVRTEEVVWQHGRASDVPETASFFTAGWFLDDWERGPAYWKPLRFEVGCRYLMAITWRGDMLGPIGSDAALQVRLDDGVIVAELDDRRDPATPVARDLGGLSIDQAADMIAGTEPHPAAEANRDRSPLERATAVHEAEYPE